jgi:ubiquinone/menaquinone biosynthesis C-methylase UbiE
MKISQSLQNVLDKQHGYPTGLAGRFIGEKMVRQHIPETHWTLEQLQLKSTDEVLEIGCGAGKALELAAAQLPAGHIVGIDLSSTMVHASKRRNARNIKTGQVTVLQADLMHLPFADNQFDKIWSIHTLYFWPDYIQAITEIGRVLKAGGLLALTFSPGTVDMTEKSAFQTEVEEKIMPAMKQIGFTTVSLIEGPASRQYLTLAVIGQK